MSAAPSGGRHWDLGSAMTNLEDIFPPANDRAPRFAVKHNYTTIITAASALEKQGNFFLFRLWPAAYFLFLAPNTPAL